MQYNDQLSEYLAEANSHYSASTGVSFLDSILLLLTPEQRKQFLKSADFDGVVYANRVPTFDKPLSIKLTKRAFTELLSILSGSASLSGESEQQIDFNDPKPLKALNEELENGVRFSPPPLDWFKTHTGIEDMPIRLETRRFGIPCKLCRFKYHEGSYLLATFVGAPDSRRDSIEPEIEDVIPEEEAHVDSVDTEHISVFPYNLIREHCYTKREFAPHICTAWDVVGPYGGDAPDIDAAALERLVLQVVTNRRYNALSRAMRERCEMLEGLVRLKMFAIQFPYKLERKSGNTFEFNVDGPPEALTGMEKIHVYRDVGDGSRRDHVPGIILERVGRRNQCELFRIPDGFQCDTPPASGYLVDIGGISQLKKQLEALRELMRPGGRPHLLRLGTLLSGDKGGLGEPVPWDTAPLRMIDQKLTERQIEAVRKALATPDICLIQGPPGTGKTRVISEIVRQAAGKNWKVLLVGPSHVAVDNVLERIGFQEEVSPVRCVKQKKLEKLPEHIQEFTYERRSSLLAKETNRRSEADLLLWQNRSDLLAYALEVLKGIADDRISANRAEQDIARHRYDISQVPVDAKMEIQRIRELQDNLVRAFKLLMVGAREELNELENSLETQDKRLKQAEQDIRSLMHVKKLDWHSRLTRNVWWRSLIIDFERKANDATERGNELRLQLPPTLSRATLAEQEFQVAETNRNKVIEEATMREDRRAEERMRSLLSAIEAKERDLSAIQQSFAAAAEKMHTKGLPAPPTFEESEIETTICQVTTEQERVQCRLTLLEDWTHYLSSESGNLKDRFAQYVNLVCATTIGIATDDYFGDKGAFVEKHFDLLVVDEAGKVTEPEFLVAAVRAKRWVLVGDHKQLPPYYDQILDPYLRTANESRKTAYQQPLDSQALRLSLFERLWHRLNPNQLQATTTAEPPLSVTSDQDSMSNDPSVSSNAAFDQFEQTAIMWRERQVTQAWEANRREEQLNEMWLQQRIGQDGNLAQPLRGKQMMIHATNTDSPEASRCVTLDVQRRMHPDLALFVSEMFYDGRYYSPFDDVYQQSKTLDLAHFPKPVTFIDICPGKGAEGYEIDLSNRDQRKKYLAEHDIELTEQRGYANLREAGQVIQVLETIASDAALQREHADLEQEGDQVPLVGIIALYAGQVALINRLIRVSNNLQAERVSESDWLCGGMRISVNSVDAFQGKECPVIILSFTRSNHRKAVGFVDDPNRLNVALSRARKKLILVGDVATLTRRVKERFDESKDTRAAGKEREFFVQLMRYVEGKGKTMRVFERRGVS